MPQLGVVSWNSGGESVARGVSLATAVTASNGTAPPASLVAIQEARISNGGGIRNRLISGAAPFAAFVNPPDRAKEYTAAQTARVGRSKAYLVSWDTAAAGLAAGGAAAATISLDPTTAAPNGVANYINGLGLGPTKANDLRVAARNIRAPVRKIFTLTVGAPAVVHTIYFYTWHVELQANWQGASWSDAGLNVNPFTGPGMYLAFMFFQNSNQYMADLAAVNGNNTDVLIIAGDLNVTGADLNGAAALFPNFVGAASNLSHILAYSNSAAGAQLNASTSFVTPFPPHSIVTTKVQW